MAESNHIRSSKVGFFSFPDESPLETEVGMNFDPTCLLKPNMSWLWKDKKTDQLKSVLTKAEEEDKNSTVEKLTNIRKECLEFKKHLDKTFDNASAINTTSKIFLHIQHKKYIF